MKLAIVGDRHYRNYGKFSKRVDKFIKENGKPTLIISGGARGVDHMAEQYAAEHEIPTKIFPADWEQFGRAAGPIRNADIVNACTHVLAFMKSGSKGTMSTVKIAAEVNKPRTVINLDKL